MLRIGTRRGVHSEGGVKTESVLLYQHNAREPTVTYITVNKANVSRRN